jgi:hypothetical protein
MVYEEHWTVMPPQVVQYADDTILILEAHARTLGIISTVLDNYALMSGLKINKTKSFFVPISMPQFLVLRPKDRTYTALHNNLTIITLFGTATIKKEIAKITYQPLIQAVQDRLKDWHGVFLSPGGRATLAKAVLSAMPMYYMQVLHIPKGVIKHIDRLRRNFIWKGKKKI